MSTLTFSAIRPLLCIANQQSSSRLLHTTVVTQSGRPSRFTDSTTPQLPPVSPLAGRLKPTSPSYYSGRPAYIDTLLELEELLRATKRTLSLSHLIAPNSPPPSAAATQTSRKNLWLSINKLRIVVGANIKTAQYKQIVARLALLARYRFLVRGGLEGTQVHVKFEETLAKFMNEQAKKGERKDLASAVAANASGERGIIDEQGRAYARGRRKESSARVWLVPTKEDATSEILVNNLPLADFFSRNTHRETLTWPFKLTGTLGAYNVFALTRGGGASGQAGAIAHATANALVAITGLGAEEQFKTEAKDKIKTILSKDGVLKRDPRMVERKKTGLAKARKAYTWVKR